MKQEQHNLLTQIYNYLMSIDTKGENTLIMSECLKAMQFLLQQPIAEEDKQEEKTDE